MRTVWGSKGDQSPFTRAVRSSASVKLPLSVAAVSLVHLPVSQFTHYLYRLCQTTSTAPPDHSRRAAAQAWVEGARFAQSAAAHESLVAAVHGHSLRVVVTRLQSARRVYCLVWHLAVSRSGSCWRGRRISSPGMRRAGVCSRSSWGAHCSGRPGDSLAFGWEDRFSDWAQLGEVCCSRGALSWCEAAVAHLRGAGRGTSFGQPATSRLHVSIQSSRYTPAQARHAWAAGPD
jgi:hypothetical protein